MPCSPAKTSSKKARKAVAAVPRKPNIKKPKVFGGKSAGKQGNLQVAKPSRKLKEPSPELSDAEAETSTDELMINVEEDEADDERSESGDVESEDEAEGEDLETDEEMDNFFVKDAAVDDMDYDASASEDEEASPSPPPKAKRAGKMVKAAAVTAKTPAQKFTIVVPPRPRKGAVDTTKTPKAKGAAKKAISFDENPFEQSSQLSATLIAGSQVSNFETDDEESFPSSPVKKPAKRSTATELKAVTKACGIDKKLCDALLKDTIKGLPVLKALAHIPLSGCKNISWQTGYSDSEEKGMASFTSMSEQMDNFDIENTLTCLINSYVKELLVFAGNKKLGVVNLSRARPSDFNLKKAPGANSNPRYTFITYKGDDQPALCLSLILAIDDYSQEMQINIRNVHSKWIAGCPLTYEYERLVAAIAMIIGDTSFKSQLADGKLTYSTRPKGIKDGSEQEDTQQQVDHVDFQEEPGNG
ncbi:hypothetical protein CPB83DRAFT_841342 [Crepidotus variabilis]|uniref:Uncharacterized protein n=1 Tax=Crepidotus variabilis TaxID=179855 RepID=A0A9P6BCN5_9AGAR|nr:hypothetical protein CPB83DRAFT_841342 [Crepidotus variabilis]